MSLTSIRSEYTNIAIPQVSEKSDEKEHKPSKLEELPSFGFNGLNLGSVVKKYENLFVVENDKILSSILDEPVKIIAVSNDSTNVYYYLNTSTKRIASISLYTTPGNCGIIIFSSLFVDVHHRNQKIGTRLTEIMEDIAKRLYYTICFATTNDENSAKILTKLKWDNFNSFKNKRSGNNIQQWIKVLD